MSVAAMAMSAMSSSARLASAGPLAALCSACNAAAQALSWRARARAAAALGNVLRAALAGEGPEPPSRSATGDDAIGAGSGGIGENGSTEPAVQPYVVTVLERRPLRWQQYSETASRSPPLGAPQRAGAGGRPGR